jgi:hypothetical protein
VTIGTVYSGLLGHSACLMIMKTLKRLIVFLTYTRTCT